MPSYYPYGSMTPAPMMYNSGAYQQPQVQPMYMINVDGEGAAKAWQTSTAPMPNTIIPLFDVDGEHVYFKSFDAYGRMNPLRKGRIVFDDEPVQNHVSNTQALPDMSSYVRKDDLDSLKQEIQSLKTMLQNKNENNQNRSNFRGDK